MESLKKLIINLISLKQEGAYWDFKREWYESNQDLLHDIICMSNNLVNRDSYILIGIDEDEDYIIKDVSNNPNRKNTQKIVDFLKDIKFAGDIRPIVYVETLNFDDDIIDVIVIQNSSNTPFYLKEKYKGVFSNQIYTRIQDTNTPTNSSADIDKIEWLWKKRFGLIETPVERIETFLGKPDGWVNGPYGEMQKYYKDFPEYTITYDFASDNRDGYVYYLFSQSDSKPNWMDIKIYYHQTLLTEIGGISLDGGRYMTPCPKTDGISVSNNHRWDIMYKYMVKESFLHKLHQFLFNNEYSSEARIARDRFIEVILLFDSEQEQYLFKEYVVEHWNDKGNYEDSINLPHIPQLEGYKVDAFKDDYEHALILQCMLKDFRKRN
ncbi:RNA-binding domain-containing protein [Marinilactibacillus psychrotolerans]|uniref:RNA-binding domain-containing protein n=1 Tax=Marinilactibacillus psychrotolerans TaxID=191770 RepID=UPI003884FE49